MQLTSDEGTPPTATGDHALGGRSNAFFARRTPRKNKQRISVTWPFESSWRSALTLSIVIGIVLLSPDCSATV